MSISLADCFNKFIGTQVIAETLEGELYTGILKQCSNELDVTLLFAQKMPIAEHSEFILDPEIAEQLLELKRVARVTGDYYVKEQIHQGFRTDHEIGAELNGDDMEKELEPWDCDDEGFDLQDEEMLFDNKTMRRSNKKGPKPEYGWPVNQMFEMNKNIVSGISTFDASLSQYSNVEISKYSEEELKRADELAKSIEKNPESKRNAFLENDDEERDLHAETEFREENTAEQRQQTQQPPLPNHQQQQHPYKQQTKKEGGGGQPQKKMDGTTKRWQDNKSGGTPNSAGWSASNWRNSQPTQQSQQRASYNNKEQSHQSGAYHPQSRPFSQQHHSQSQHHYSGKPKFFAGNKQSNYEPNGSQGPSERSRNNEARMVTVAAKPNEQDSINTSEQQSLNEDKTQQQIPPDPETTAKESNPKRIGDCGGEQNKTTDSLVSEPGKEFNDELEEEKGSQEEKKFEFNPNAAPFVPKSKDLTSSAASNSTFTTTPLMSSHVPTFVPMQIQVPSAAATAQIPHVIPPQNLFYQQQPQPATVIQPQMPSQFFAYHTGNPAQPIIYFATNHFMQQGSVVQQQFVPVSANALPPQNIQQVYFRTGTPNGGHGQVSQTLVDSATGNPIIAHPSTIFAAPQPGSAGSGPIPNAAMISGALPLMSSFPHVPPNMHHWSNRSTGTPNSNGLGQQQIPSQPPTQQQQPMIDSGGNAQLVLQQNHHQFSTIQPTSLVAVNPPNLGVMHHGAMPLLSNITQMPPAIPHQHYHRTGTPGTGGVGLNQSQHSVIAHSQADSQLSSQQQMSLPTNIYMTPPPPNSVAQQQNTAAAQQTVPPPLLNFQMPSNAAMASGGIPSSQPTPFNLRHQL